MNDFFQSAAWREEMKNKPWFIFKTVSIAIGAYVFIVAFLLIGG